MMIHKILHISFSRLNREQSLNAGFRIISIGKAVCLQHLKCLLVASGKLWHLRKLLFFCIYKPQHHSDKPLQNCKHAAEIVQFFAGDWVGHFHPTIGSSLYQVTVNQYLMWIIDLGQKKSMHAACL